MVFMSIEITLKVFAVCSCLLDCKPMINFRHGFLRADQDSAKNYSQMDWIGCPIMLKAKKYSKSIRPVSSYTTLDQVVAHQSAPFCATPFIWRTLRGASNVPPIFSVKSILV